MILFSLGLPSPFGEWCEALTARFMKYSFGLLETIYADTLEQFALSVIKTSSPHIMVGSRQIVGPLWAALAQTNRGFIVAHDDPHIALRNLVVRHGMDFLLAARIVAKSCASIVSCAALPGALVLHAGQSEADPIGTARAIAHHLGLALGEAEIADSVMSLEGAGVWPTSSNDTEWWDGLEPWERDLVAGAIDPYVARLAGGDLWPLTWEKEFFFLNEEQPEQHSQVASRPVNITGRPRFLVYGPDITLPPGSWCATVALGFSHEAAELSYIVDLHAGNQLAQVRLEPAGRRVVGADLNFSIAEPQMIAVRVRNERAAFDGRMALGNVTMTPHASMRAETRSYLTTALIG